VRPKYFIPVHGDYRNLQKHARIAMETGAVEHAIVIEDGDVLEIDKHDARKKDKVTAGRILIDSGLRSTCRDLVIKDRRILSEDGIVLAVLAINKRTGKVEQQPEVIMRALAAQTLRAGKRACPKNTRRPEHRAEIRLRHGEGKSPRRVEAADPKDHRPQADDHARDSEI